MLCGAIRGEAEHRQLMREGTQGAAAGCAVRQCRAAHMPINCATAACRASPLTTRRLPPAACHLLMGATGALLGAREAIARMQRQQSGGKVFFVDGNGRWGHA